MSNYITKYGRGDVWFVNDDKMNYIAGSEQDKSRPWLIISCDAHNSNSQVLNVVPLSTGFTEKKYHVGFEYQGRPQVIHCESPMSKSVERFEMAGSHYMYKLSDELMKKVDAALKLNLGLDSQVDYMLKDVEKMIDDLINKKQAQITYLRDNPVVTEEFINTVALKIGDMVSTVPLPKILPEDTAGKEEINESISEVAPAEVVDIPTPPVKSKRRRWDRETSIEFLNMLDTRPAFRVAEAFNLNSVQSVYTTKYNILKKYGDLRDGKANS